MTRSRGEEEMAFLLTHASSFPFERQYAFHPVRRWRADFAVWPNKEWHGVPGCRPLLVEIEGAKRGRAPGRHQRIDGMEADCEKYAEAMCLGYTVLRVMPRQVRGGIALIWIERLMEQMLSAEAGS